MAGGGAFIVLEGPDGAGKTTQARRLVEGLERRGLPSELVREPGGTPIGEKIRAILLDPANEPMDARTELLLYMASRAQLCREKIQPALERGRIVVADRFLASSVVYQGLVGGLGAEEVLATGLLATGGLKPDITVILDVDAERATARVAKRAPRDRLEQKDADYHRRVFAGYRAYVKLDPNAVLVPATGGEDEVGGRVLFAIEPALARLVERAS
jgi:dTMP kinase